MEGSAGSDLALLVGVSLYGINELVYFASRCIGAGNHLRLSKQPWQQRWPAWSPWGRL